MKVYHVAVYQVADNGDFTGIAVLNRSFRNLKAATKAGLEARLSPLSLAEVREYDLSSGKAVIAFDTEKDTGKIVERDIAGIREALDERFHDLCDACEDFEGTMSYLIDMIKEDVFPEEHRLHDAVNLLTDDEVNAILEDYGDDEYMVCVNGELRPIDKEDHDVAED